MQRKVITLSKDTVLWEAGDTARTVAVVAKGKLGARTNEGLVGILLPNMVIGESALFASESGNDAPGTRRTVSIFALEDDTLVLEYPAEEVRIATEAGDHDLMRQILTNLVGQICRNLLMVVTAKRGYPYIDDPLMGLVQGIVKDAREREPLSNWTNLMLTCRFLSDLRDLSDRLLHEMGPEPAQRSELIVNASQMLAQLAEGHDVGPIFEVFLNAEREKNQWWARGGEEA